MLKACLFLLLIQPARSLCQAGSNFAKNIKIIDLICQKIDKDTLLMNIHVEFSKDDSSGFTAEGNYLVDTKGKEIKKFVYKSYEDGITVKTFYYYNKALVKVVDDNQVYNYTGSLRDTAGAVLPAALTQRLFDVAGLVDKKRVTHFNMSAIPLRH